MVTRKSGSLASLGRAFIYTCILQEAACSALATIVEEGDAERHMVPYMAAILQTLAAALQVCCDCRGMILASCSAVMVCRHEGCCMPFEFAKLAFAVLSCAAVWAEGFAQRL
jgi:hypothetical protein